MEKKYSPVFILGMPRSGTSLLRGLLSGHSEIAVPPRGEIQFFKDWNEKYGDLNIESNRNAFLSSFFEQKKLKFWEISEGKVRDKFLESDNFNYLSFHKSLMQVYQEHNKKRDGGTNLLLIFTILKIYCHFTQMLNLFSK